MDTIVALATAQGKAGVSVIRVSGERAFEVCERLSGSVPPERKAAVQRLRDGDGLLIDEALVLVFEAGRSFTGERVCEFQVHGSVAVIGLVLRSCLSMEGVRSAEPGEFTRRAFMNGRLDLTQVEALADLIDAETEAQRRQAQAVLDGSARRVIDGWREDLLQAQALVEAVLDFSDEDLPTDLEVVIRDRFRAVEASIEEALRARHVSERVREGFEVALVGRVNAGKSTLLNAIAGRDVAITSAIAGTTRDVIEVRLDLGGLPVTLIDTAGLRESDDPVEQEGIARGKRRAASADLRVHLIVDGDEGQMISSDDDILVRSKVDITGGHGISALTGEGVANLLDEIERRLLARAKGSGVFSRERHYEKLSNAKAHLDNAQRGLRGAVPLDLVAEEARLAVRSLDGIIGRVDVEDVLGRIFASFCIGK